MVTSQYQSLEQPFRERREQKLRIISTRRPSLLLLFVVVCVLSTLYVISSSLLGKSKRDRDWSEEVEVEQRRNQTSEDNAEKGIPHAMESMKNAEDEFARSNNKEADVVPNGLQTLVTSKQEMPVPPNDDGDGSSEKLIPEGTPEKNQTEMFEASKISATGNFGVESNSTLPINKSENDRNGDLSINHILPNLLGLQNRGTSEKVEGRSTLATNETDGVPLGTMVNDSTLSNRDLSFTEKNTPGTNNTGAGDSEDISKSPDTHINSKLNTSSAAEDFELSKLKAPKNYTEGEKKGNRTNLFVNGSLGGGSTFILQSNVAQSQPGLGKPLGYNDKKDFSQIAITNESDGGADRISEEGERNAIGNGEEANDNNVIAEDTDKANVEDGSIGGNKDEAPLPVGEVDATHNIAPGTENRSVGIIEGITESITRADEGNSMFLEANGEFSRVKEDIHHDTVGVVEGNNIIHRADVKAPQVKGGQKGHIAGAGDEISSNKEGDAEANDIIPGAKSEFPLAEGRNSGAEGIVSEAIITITGDTGIVPEPNNKVPHAKGGIIGEMDVESDNRVEDVRVAENIPGANIKVHQAEGAAPDNIIGVAGSNIKVHQAEGGAPDDIIGVAGANDNGNKANGKFLQTKGGVFSDGVAPHTAGGAPDDRMSVPGSKSNRIPQLSEKTKELLASLHLSPFGQNKEIGAIKVRPSSRNIFFVESSCVSHNSITPTGGEAGGVVLALRHACSAYAAASLHPDRTVHIYHSCPLNLDYYSRSNPAVRHLLDLPNVLVVPVKGRLTSNPTKLGLALVWKYGGTYLSLEALTTRSLDSLGEDWVEADGWAFSFGHSVNGQAAVARLLNSVSNRLQDPLSASITRLCSTQGNLQINPNRACNFKVYKAESLLRHYFRSARLAEPGLTGEPSPLCPIKYSTNYN